MGTGVKRVTSSSPSTSLIALPSSSSTSSSSSSAAAPPGSLKKKGRSRKGDSSGPKRPLSAYMLWTNDVRPAVKAQHPGSLTQEMGSILGAMWREMSDDAKLPYRKQAQAEMAAWLTQKHARKAAQALQEEARTSLLGEDDEDNDSSPPPPPPAPEKKKRKKRQKPEAPPAGDKEEEDDEAVMGAPSTPKLKSVAPTSVAPTSSTPKLKAKVGKADAAVAPPPPAPAPPSPKRAGKGEKIKSGGKESSEQLNGHSGEAADKAGSAKKKRKAV